MSLVIKEFGGYILKYVGDAVLAFFNVPEINPERNQLSSNHLFISLHSVLHNYNTA